MKEMPDDLDLIMRKSEKLTVEYKRSWSNPKEIRETIMAFANALGGHLFVGVEEISEADGEATGKPIGVRNPGIHEARARIRDWSREFSPPVETRIDSYLSQEGKRIDVINVEPAREKPVCLRNGLYKIRALDGNMGITPSEMRNIMLGIENYLDALRKEYEHNVHFLEILRKKMDEDIPYILLGSLRSGTTEAILNNGALAMHFNFDQMYGIYQGYVLVNKVLEFVVTGLQEYGQGYWLGKLRFHVDDLRNLLEKEILELSG